jgi:hypothetical protein
MIAETFTSYLLESNIGNAEPLVVTMAREPVRWTFKF